MDGLYMVLTSFADMTPARSIEVARAFDRHPSLRPLRVGGDPARIRVEPSLEAVITTHGLPTNWLSVRRNGRYPDFEGGQINLHPGRGGWLGLHGHDPRDFLLTGHSIEQHWIPATVHADGVTNEVAALFEDLIAATDPAFACVSTKPVSHVIRFRLPDLGWLTYLGPSFVSRHPALATVTDARTMPLGGVLIRIGEQPCEETTSPLTFRAEIEGILGVHTFTWDERRQNPSLPTEAEHVAASPGTSEMPWVGWVAKKADHDREKKHKRARQRLLTALDDRGSQPSLPQPPVEWSTSMDLTDWPDFVRYLRRKLGGDLTAALGRALVIVIETGPVGDHGDLVLDTRIGAVSLGWLIDDETTLDLSIAGTPETRDICNAWFD